MYMNNCRKPCRTTTSTTSTTSTTTNCCPACDNALIVSEASQTLCYGDEVVLDENVELNGTSIRHEEGESEIMLSANSRFLVNYSVTTKLCRMSSCNCGGKECAEAEFALELNNQMYAGSESLDTICTGKYITISKSVVVSTGSSATNELVLVYSGRARIKASNVSISIVRIC